MSRSATFVESAELAKRGRQRNNAFALGRFTLLFDNEGHSIAVQPSRSDCFTQNCVSKYGDRVTYVEDPTASSQAVSRISDECRSARGRYKSEDYHDFIGFKVSKPVLERAFKAT